MHEEDFPGEWIRKLIQDERIARKTSNLLLILSICMSSPIFMSPDIQVPIALFDIEEKFASYLKKNEYLIVDLKRFASGLQWKVVYQIILSLRNQKELQHLWAPKRLKTLATTSSHINVYRQSTTATNNMFTKRQGQIVTKICLQKDKDMQPQIKCYNQSIEVLKTGIFLLSLFILCSKD